MGIHTIRSKARARWLPGAGAALVAATLLLGCSAAGPPSTAPDEQSVQAAAAAIEEPAIGVETVDLIADENVARIVITASGPMTWTSFRSGDGDLVVELPDAALGGGIAEAAFQEGFVTSARIEEDRNEGMTMTRLVIETAIPAEHSISAQDSGLVIELVASDTREPLEVAAVAPEIPDADVVEIPVPVTPGPEAEVGLAPAGTAEDPLMGPAPEGVEATRLQSVDVWTDDESTVVWISGDGAFSYSTFSIEDPDRFVVDLIGVVNTSPVATITVEDELVGAVRVAQYKSKPDLVSRVVVDLRDSSVPRIDTTSDGMTLRFATTSPDLVAAGTASGDSGSKTAEEVVLFEPVVEEVGLDAGEPAYQTAGATGVAVESELGDEGEVVEGVIEEESVSAYEAEAGDPGSEISIAEEEMLLAQVVEEPVADDSSWEAEASGTAFEEIDPAVDVDEPAEAAVDQMWDDEEPLEGEASLLEFAAVDVDEPERSYEPREVVEVAEETFSGEPMTLTLRDADIKDVLRSFAQISGLNVVVQPEVGGTVTVELTNVPWDQALDQILKINGLGYQLEGNIMRVAPIDLLRREEEEKAQLAAAKARSIPLKTMMRRISYAAADELASILRSGGGASVMSDRGSVIVDRRTNTLIIKELPSHIDTVIAVIENLDIPEPQVMIEARIIETTKRFSRSLGVEWGLSGVSSPIYGNTTDLQFPNRGSVDGGVELLTGGSNGILDISLGNVTGSFNLDLMLQAAESEGLINILSAPKITTLNNERATIQSGLQIPIQTIANNTVSVQFVNATLRLEVTPHVTAEGTVLMDIDIQKREPQLAFAVVGAANAPIATKDASTRVIVRDGGTTVIGGIYKVTSDQGEDRVPGLSNVPILKHLFKNKRRNDENEELLIFITPRVIRL
jgi:type IV pilus assembly protein PilQ